MASLESGPQMRGNGREEKVRERTQEVCETQLKIIECLGRAGVRDLERGHLRCPGFEPRRRITQTQRPPEAGRR